MTNQAGINEEVRTPNHKPLGRRLAVAGVLTAAVLAGGAGFAYAGNAQGSPAGTQGGESGYATVVDEGSQTQRGSASDCPERGSGGSSEGPSEGPSDAPSDAPSETPEQTPTPDGDL